MKLTLKFSKGTMRVVVFEHDNINTLVGKLVAHLHSNNTSVVEPKETFMAALQFYIENHLR